MIQGPDPGRDPYRPLYEPIQPPTRDYARTDLADRSARFAARLIDTLFFVVTAVPFGVGMFFGAVDHVGRAMVLLPPLLVLLTYQSVLVATTGQSIAKRWLGIRVVRADGSPVGFVRGVVVREWLVFAIGCIPFVGLLSRLFDSAMILGEERRCVHDLLAGTQVVPASAPVRVVPPSLPSR
jgi:uncharacterized RDD family membrane protein YckC